MKKDPKAEVAIRAFRTYARLGLFREESSLGVLCRIRGICSDSTALDMLAVFDTLRILDLMGEAQILRSVRDIYFATARKPLRANEISLRVRRLAYELHCDDRSIYRYLKKARELWLSLRQKEKKQTAGDRSLLCSMIGRIT